MENISWIISLIETYSYILLNIYQWKSFYLKNTILFLSILLKYYLHIWVWRKMIHNNMFLNDHLYVIISMFYFIFILNFEMIYVNIFPHICNVGPSIIIDSKKMIMFLHNVWMKNYYWYICHMIDLFFVLQILVKSKSVYVYIWSSNTLLLY